MTVALASDFGQYQIISAIGAGSDLPLEEALQVAAKEEKSVDLIALARDWSMAKAWLHRELTR